MNLFLCLIKDHAIKTYLGMGLQSYAFITLSLDMSGQLNMPADLVWGMYQLDRMPGAPLIHFTLAKGKVPAFARYKTWLFLLMASCSIK